MLGTLDTGREQCTEFMCHINLSGEKKLESESMVQDQRTPFEISAG